MLLHIAIDAYIGMCIYIYMHIYIYVYTSILRSAISLPESLRRGDGLLCRRPLPPFHEQATLAGASSGRSEIFFYSSGMSDVEVILKHAFVGSVYNLSLYLYGGNGTRIPF